MISYLAILIILVLYILCIHKVVSDESAKLSPEFIQKLSDLVVLLTVFVSLIVVVAICYETRI